MSNARNDTPGKKLFKLRKERGERQDVIASVLRCDRSTISKYENEESPIPSEFIPLIARHYGVSADYLLGLTKYASTQTTKESKTIRAICDYTGLTETAAKELHKLSCSDRGPFKKADILSSLLCSSELDLFILCVQRLKELLDDGLKTDDQLCYQAQHDSFDPELYKTWMLSSVPESFNGKDSDKIAFCRRLLERAVDTYGSLMFMIQDTMTDFAKKQLVYGVKDLRCMAEVFRQMESCQENECKTTETSEDEDSDEE